MIHVSPAIHEHQALELRAERDRLRAVLMALNAKIGHFADAPASPDMPMLGIIGDVARIVRETLAKPAA